MRFLNLTLLCCMLNVLFTDVALECPSSSSPNTSIVPHCVAPGTTNIFLQSKDGGLTWQDISHSLPAVDLPEDFFAGESDLYLRVNNVNYHSKSNLKAPVWEKDSGQYWKQAQDKGREVVESNGVLMATSQQGIVRSTDNGEHWESVINEGGVGIDIEVIHGGFAAIAYNTTTQTRRVHISEDAGKTWKTISDGLQPSKSISSIKQIGNYLICGHPDGIFRSPDTGKTWYMVHPAVEEFKYVQTFKIEASFNPKPVIDTRKVFKIYSSGNTLYAMARNSGC